MRISTAPGADWIRNSLAQGAGLATLMVQRLGKLQAAWLLAPARSSEPGTVLDDHGRGIRTTDADLIAERLFAAFVEAGATTLVVEDDLARRGDPALGSDVVFIDDHVVRWADLRAGAAAAVRLLRTGASGYPLNAFVCYPAAVELGLETGKTLDASRQAALVDSACAVIVSVYDAETYIVLMSSDLEPRVEQSFPLSRYSDNSAGPTISDPGQP